MAPLLRSQGGTMRHSPESSPGLAAGAAGLRRLRRVDAVEADTLSANPEDDCVGDGRYDLRCTEVGDDVPIPWQTKTTSPMRSVLRGR